MKNINSLLSGAVLVTLVLNGAGAFAEEFHLNKPSFAPDISQSSTSLSADEIKADAQVEAQRVESRRVEAKFERAKKEYNSGWENLKQLAMKANMKNEYGDMDLQQFKKGAYVFMDVNVEPFDGASLGAQLTDWKFNKTSKLYETVLVYTEGSNTLIQKYPVSSRALPPLRRFQVFCLRVGDNKEYSNQYGEKIKLTSFYLVGASGGNTGGAQVVNHVIGSGFSATDFTYDPVELKKLRDFTNKKGPGRAKTWEESWSTKTAR